MALNASAKDKLSASYTGDDSINGRGKTESAVVSPFGVIPELLEKACVAVNAMIEQSKIFDPQAEECIPRFSKEELVIGRVLGRGGFCVVSDISKIVLNESANFNEEMLRNRKLLTSRCIRNNESRYAIKRLSDDLHKDKDRYVKGMIDLALEIKFLAVIEHPHIIKMRAVSNTDPYSNNCFLVLDRLYDTLDKAVKKWKLKENKVKGIGKLRDLKGKKKDEILIERIHVLFDLASALGYLHSKSIVFRDLKPDNIAFDVRGDVKIFDFGLAKELRPEKKNSDGTYNLTGYTGSLRFMAPEVAQYKPYNETADVFSYGVLMWQILSYSTPYSNYTVNMYMDLIVGKGYRLTIPSKWSESLKELLKLCWNQDLKLRASFVDIKSVIREEISRIEGTDEELDFDISNRSISGKKM